MAIQPYIVEQKYDDARLDKVLMDLMEGVTFGMVQKMCRKGQIRVEGKRVKAGDRVFYGQEVRIPPFLMNAAETADDVDKTAVQPLSKEDKRLIDNSILYEDTHLVVINKPYGLPVQAGSGHSRSLDRLMVSYYGETCQPKLVHRLDKTTTGCVLFAKSRGVAAQLSASFKQRDMEKTYWAIVKGNLRQKEGKITERMLKGNVQGYEQMVMDEEGQKAETDYRHISSAGMYHWLEIKPKTGRTHQIRAHMACIGVPIVGDVKYGGERLTTEQEDIPSNRIFLHAREIQCEAGNLGYLHFVASLPDHFKKAFEIFDWDLAEAKVDS